MPQEEKPKESNNQKDLEHTKKRFPWKESLISGVVGAALVGTVVVATNLSGESHIQQAVSEQVSQVLSSGTTSTGETKVQNASLNVTTNVTDIVQKVSGAVVSVENLSKKNNDTYDLFGFTKQNESSSSSDSSYTTASEGSGVIYKVEGDKAYIVTNNHVVEGSDAVEVILEDGTQVRVDIVGRDQYTDLAVLSMPAKYAKTVAEFGDSSTLKVGEPAIAIGSPLGSEFASTVTEGIISGLNRQVETDTDGDGKADWVTNAIQTDAAINPGNSGGPLVNSAGQVIGINSMKISSNKVEGMGFAIPSNDVKEVIAQLESKGKVVRASLGVQMVSLYQISLERKESILKLPDDITEGVVLMDVQSNSPASNAGLKQYDVITKFAGTDIKDTTTLRQALYQQNPNAKVEVEFYRNGQKQTTTVQLVPES